MQASDIYLMFDAGQRGNEVQLTSLPFMTAAGALISKDKWPITLTYTEQSIADRRNLVRGRVSQTEMLYVISDQFLSFPVRDKKHFGGTNRGDSWGPFPMCPVDTLWALPWKAKKALYGVANRVAVGGLGPNRDKDEEAEDRKARQPPRRDTDVEPVTWGAMSVQFYEELQHCFFGKGMVNLTSTDVNPCIACIKAKLPYVGVVFTQAHKEAFKAEVVKHIFQLFQEEGPLHQPNLVRLLKPVPTHPVRGRAPPKPKITTAPKNPTATSSGKAPGTATKATTVDEPAVKAEDKTTKGTTAAGRQSREEVLAELALLRGGDAIVPDTKAIDVEEPETEDEKIL